MSRGHGSRGGTNKHFIHVGPLRGSKFLPHVDSFNQQEEGKFYLQIMSLLLDFMTTLQAYGGWRGPLYGGDIGVGATRI